MHLHLLTCVAQKEFVKLIFVFAITCFYRGIAFSGGKSTSRSWYLWIPEIVFVDTEGPPVFIYFKKCISCLFHAQSSLQRFIFKYKVTQVKNIKQGLKTILILLGKKENQNRAKCKRKKKKKLIEPM